MIRLLLIIVAVCLAVSLVLRRMRSILTKRHTKSMAKLVRCDYCGLYLPADEVIRSGEGTYCCEEHKRRSEA